ncbi:MAG: phenylacetic acid degradation protein PaaN [Bacteroidia bacterium]
MSTATASSLFQKHEGTLRKAITAIHERTFYAAFLEAPSKSVYGETGHEDGLAAFNAQVGKPYAGLLQSSDAQLAAGEESPYTLEALNISYPSRNNPADYVTVAQGVAASWAKADVYTRAGILTESLHRVSKRFFELTFATMHTTGQSYMMSFQASGPHSNDRALEALALGLHEQTRWPNVAEWVKPMGKDKEGNPMYVKLEKRWVLQPLGVALAIGCSTFPVWNTVPGVYASLITGNPVIVKPHPKAIYPLALVVDEIQKALAENGFDPNIVQLAPDTAAAPLAKVLAENAAVRIIDYTGGSAFGNYLEGLKGKRTFTEKAGVNSIVIGSTKDVKSMMQNIAFSLSLYSGQMCTAPQNIFIPRDGIDTPEGKLSYADTVAALAGSIQKLVTHEKMGPGTLGAIQNPATLDRVQQARDMGLKEILGPQTVVNAEFPKARIGTPAVFEVEPTNWSALSTEMFGPVVFVVPVDNYRAGVDLAAKLASAEGALSFTTWNNGEEEWHYAIEKMAESYTNVSINFVGPIWANQSAAFSDFHGTGGNPAANASLTDPEFVLGRFKVVGVRIHH